MKKRFLCVLLAAVLLTGMVSPAIPEANAQNLLHTSQAMLDLICAFEGFSGACYQDGSQRSVGYGTKCEYCDPSVPGYPLSGPCAVYTAENPITEEHAKARMMEELAGFESELYAFASWHGLTYTQSQFDALVSLSYNCGGNWRFDSEGILRDAVISGDMGDYLAYAFGCYSKSNKVLSIGHMKRRLIEADVYINGYYGDAGTWPETLRYVLLEGNGGTVKRSYQAFDATEVCTIRADITSVPKDGAGNDLTFAGWYTQPEGGKKIENLTGVLTNGMVLYAQWKNAAGETVTVDTDTSVPADVSVVVSAWWPNTLYEGPGKYYSEVRRATEKEQLHITKTVTGADGNLWGYCSEGWIPLADTNYSSMVATPAPDGTWYQITASAVNVRSGPDTSCGVVGSRANGAKVVIVETQENTEDNQTWGKLSDGNWICIRNGSEPAYAVVLDPQPENPTVTPTPVKGWTVKEMYISSLPTVRTYPVGGLDVLPDLTGGELTLVYSNEAYSWTRTVTVPITRFMVSGFDNSEVGVKTITVTCGGKTATYTVEVIPKVITGIAVENKPAKLEYQLNKDGLDLTGATLLVNYEKDVTRVVDITPDMVTGFDNTVLGTNTLTVSYAGFTTTFDVNIVDRVVTFLNYDGSVLSQQVYELGAAVEPPATPSKPEDASGEYVFVGWDKPVVPCDGSATYTAVFTLCHTVTFLNYDGSVLSAEKYLPGTEVLAPANPTKPADEIGEYVFAGWDKELTVCSGKATYTATYKLRYAPGDLDRNGTLDSDDAIYLLRHVLFPEKYPVYAWAEWNGDGVLDSDDAIYLLRHVLFPEKYPLKTP